MSKSNGSTPKTRHEALKEQREEKQRLERESKRETGALRDAFNEDGALSEEFIESMISDEDFDRGGGKMLQSRTVAKLQNMLSRDVVLGNLTEAQEHDMRYKLDVMKLKIMGIHPSKKGVTGELRAFLMDDKSENVQALTQQERILLDDFFEALKIRLTRGREGFEREQMNTSISRAETDADRQRADDSGWGLFS